MHLYTIHQWLLLFYFYCFIGWIWESVYVSLGKHKWVNRGFLKGPFLPIYGYGAVVVLLSTLTVEKNLILVFIIGMIAATILEYITGAVMEKIFHIRYWDYTDKPFNVNGHICLLSTLAWGLFSILLVRFVNPPIENWIIGIPEEISEISAYIITVFITIDGVQSFNEAINLKSILIKITERNETVNIIKSRLEVVEAIISEDVKDLQEKLTYRSETKQENKIIKRQNKSQYIESVIRKKLGLTEAKIRSLSEKLSLYMDKLENISYRGIGDSESLRAEFKEYINKLKSHESRIHNTESRIYISSINILRRNPNAKTKKYEEAMNEVKELEKDLKKK
ncbi:putative ABC transporter permease [Clostridium sp. D53t1_180928_C8]|uniref:putative ABC transporter permease n=1 Tax=Clostridium sp. D53t1_180928_C8 TaxID=2787101 RepID=UPI0018AB94D2|nr:putative ABC transporter permease [Clostridium sp. D53t1_180928_C8]